MLGENRNTVPSGNLAECFLAAIIREKERLSKHPAVAIIKGQRKKATINARGGGGTNASSGVRLNGRESGTPSGEK